MAKHALDATGVIGSAHRTWPANRTPALALPFTIPCFGLDYVFIPPSWIVISTRILGPTGSDHLPVLVEIAMTTQRADGGLRRGACACERASGLG